MSAAALLCCQNYAMQKYCQAMLLHRVKQMFPCKAREGEMGGGTPGLTRFFDCF